MYNTMYLIYIPIFIQFAFAVEIPSYLELLPPICKTQNYSIYRASDLLKSNQQQLLSYNEDVTWIVVKPTNDTIPNDNGGNFGDLLFNSTKKDGFLLGRETIINEKYPFDVLVIYSRFLQGYYVKDFKVLNFGRERAYTQMGAIYHEGSTMEAWIYISAGSVVRVFAEVYGKLCNGH